MSRPLRSLIIVLSLVTTGVGSASGQFRPPGRYDLPASSGVERTSYVRESPYYERQPGPVEPTSHGSWPTHAMHEPLADETNSGRADHGSGQSDDSMYDDSAYDGSTFGGHSIAPVGYPQAPDTFTFPPEPPLRSRVRQRLWQPEPCDDIPCDAAPPWIVPYQTNLKTTVLPGDGDELGLTDVDARVMLAIPSWPGFTITPGGIVGFVDGPLQTDLPSQLDSVWVEFQYMTQLSQQWSMQLAVAPGLYTDFEDVNSDAFRITGRALAFYGISLQTQIVFGVVYLDREDVAILPAAGVIHQPTENLRLEILFPRPRVLYRVQRGDVAGEREGWVYLAGEFGGGSWQIQRTNGASDVTTYSDLRMIAGYEWRSTATRTLFVEGGWVFSRSLEYTSGRGDYDPDDTGLVRAGVTF